MKAGDVVFVKVNGGMRTEAQVIEIHGDIVRLAGKEEIESARAAGKPPLGVGFNVHKIEIA